MSLNNPATKLNHGYRSFYVTDNKVPGSLYDKLFQAIFIFAPKVKAEPRNEFQSLHKLNTFNLSLVYVKFGDE